MSLLDFMDESSEMFEEAMKTADDFRDKKRKEQQARNYDDLRTRERSDRKDSVDGVRKSIDRSSRAREIGRNGNDIIPGSSARRAVDAEERHNRRHTNESFIELF